MREPPARNGMARRATLRFFGIVVAMYYDDHPPPHFHVRYGEYRLRFEDGVAGELDFADRLRFEGIFAPLSDPAAFAQVRIHPELGTVAWPNGADLDPDVLYAELSGTAIAVRPAPTRRIR